MKQTLPDASSGIINIANGTTKADKAEATSEMGTEAAAQNDTP